MVYGQAGSDSSEIMGMEQSGPLSASNTAAAAAAEGIIPRALRWVFGRLQAPSRAGYKDAVRVSLVVIHNDLPVDLLAVKQTVGKAPRTDACQRSSASAGWTGAREVAVTSADAALALLANGIRRRRTAGNQSHATSSGSHTVFTVVLTQTRQQQSGVSGEAEPAKIESRLSLVDLAHPKPVAKWYAAGRQMREGIATNTGLLVLGRVISALADTNRGRRIHIPYRDSELTRLLRSALDGNAQTVFLACVSTAIDDTTKTTATLQYAARARGSRSHYNLDDDEAFGPVQPPPMQRAQRALQAQSAQQPMQPLAQLRAQQRVL
ncbi:hypothetical protein LPJ61_004479 [Coemansia biformis]|uniref:Kinesin motor domain-containing protein n=1 Tax=Coemansia biformis TaxID=1286918 RepID=A0A9W7Y4R3_9FUNG|nr:hypothetical protein LPJ61_004479 [Coemansia biformis]